MQNLFFLSDKMQKNIQAEKKIVKTNLRTKQAVEMITIDSEKRAINW